MNDKKRKTDLLLNMMLVLFILIFLVAVAILVRYYVNSMHQKKMNREIIALRQERLQEEIHEEGDNPAALGEEGVVEETAVYRETAEMLSQINSDYVCFLTLDEEHMYPVVQRDNEYYLHTNFRLEKNSRGAIFLDENCTPQDQVYLLHGHHMKDGTMFGCLTDYMNSEYRENHKTIYMDYGEGDIAYEIFAVGLFDLALESHFHYYEIPDKGEVEDYIKKLCENSMWYGQIQEKTNIQQYLEAENQSVPHIVLLSTCEYRGQDQRLVIAAVKRK